MSSYKENHNELDSSGLHNRNCFAYLKQIKISNSLLNAITVLSETLPKEQDRAKAVKLWNMLIELQKQEAYSEYPFADLYTLFFEVVEDNIDAIYDYHKSTKHLGKFKELISSIYHNDNDILKNTYAAIKQDTLLHAPIDGRMENKISNRLKDNGKSINRHSLTPQEAGSAIGRLNALLSANFKPQHTTSLATLRHYEHQGSNTPIEYRFGTQGQRHNSQPRVSPLFKYWLKLGTPHIYFNNLGLDRSDLEGNKERELSLALHELEADHPNLCVITLPADKGSMSQSEYKNINTSYDAVWVYDKFLAIAMNGSDLNATTNEIRDFYISPKFKDILYAELDGGEEGCLKELLNQSLIDLGLVNKPRLSGSERQALWFHFTKFELTNFIIDRLKPAGINFSCKDAIDRGAVSSVYYQLMNSIESNIPMQREKFEEALHAAAAMVKGRGMNSNLNLIWNALDIYIEANYDRINDDSRLTWLIEWRDFNCPYNRVSELLARRVKQGLELLKPLENSDKVVLGRNILTAIREQSDLNLSGKRLLLEAAARTPNLILKPELTDPLRDRIRYYSDLTEKLTISYPKLQILTGLMKMLVGSLLFIPSIGKSRSLITAGLATSRAGFYAKTRTEMLENIKALDEENREEERRLEQENCTPKNMDSGFIL